MKKRELKARVAELEAEVAAWRRMARDGARRPVTVQEHQTLPEAAYVQELVNAHLAVAGEGVPPMPTTQHNEKDPDLFAQRVERVERLMGAVEAPPKPAYEKELEATRRKALADSMGEHPAMAPCLCNLPDCPTVREDFSEVKWVGLHGRYGDDVLTREWYENCFVIRRKDEHMGCYPYPTTERRIMMSGEIKAR